MTKIKGIRTTILLIQLFDMAIHIAINQFEPIRVIANIIIITWVVVFRKNIQLSYRLVTSAVIGIYLLLNGMFLAQNGLTNPEQEGAPRITLFLLVLLTVGLSTLSTYLRSKASRTVERAI